ncbi:glycosyl hydrolase [Bacteroides rhinocerotis]|uniref:glycosyl hydrolase n=1 Tax=Bacteroides rhinocerotis TaxID=2989541 RepID=UPI0038CC10D6
MWRIQLEVNGKMLNISNEHALCISRYMTSTDKLVWDVSKGAWGVLRTGMMPTGRTNFPGGPDGTGLEIDKMSKGHLAMHFDTFIGQILTRIPAQDRRIFKVWFRMPYSN